MAINPVGTSDTINYTSEKSSQSKEVSVDTNMFLKLLVAQLKYQDPLEPQKDTAFVTQLAQMSSLQQMQLTNATLKNSQAYDMIGKGIYAEVLNKETGVTMVYTGVVSSVVIKDGIPYVVIENQAINVEDIKEVFPVTLADDTTEDTDTTTDGTTTDDTITV